MPSLHLPRWIIHAHVLCCALDGSPCPLLCPLPRCCFHVSKDMPLDVHNLCNELETRPSTRRNATMSGGPSRGQHHLSKDGQEEHFLLRATPQLAARLHRVLEEDPVAADDHAMSLEWEQDATHAKLQVGKDAFRARLYNLPTAVETWKSYDDVHLVKSGDVGQVVVVMDEAEDGHEHDEYPHGITKPMEHARKRHFRKEADVPPEVMRRVELDVRHVLQGGTAQGVEIVDVEEEFIDGEWRPVQDTGDMPAKDQKQIKEKQPDPTD